MRSVIRRFDEWQCRRSGVFTFSNDPECLFRLQLTEATHDRSLPGCAVKKGEPVLVLHLWNEHMPLIARDGPALSWAIQFQRGLIYSFKLMASYVNADPALRKLPALLGIWAILSEDEKSGGVQLIRRLGFTVFPYQHKLGQFGEFWENFYSWWLIWTYNPGSSRDHNMLKMHRTEIWMPIEELIRRYLILPQDEQEHHET